MHEPRTAAALRISSSIGIRLNGLKGIAMPSFRRLAQVQMRRGWTVTVDDEQFRVADNGFDEAHNRIYILRDQHGEERTMLRTNALDLLASGRLRITTRVEATLIGKIELIRDYARHGHSMYGTAKALGLYGWEVRRAIELCRADDIEFVKGTQSVEFRESLQRLHAGRRGRPQPHQNPRVYEALKRGRETLRQRAAKLTAFGFTGTIRELINRFDFRLSEACLRARLKRGLSIEKALTSRPVGTVTSALPITHREIDAARSYAKRGHSLHFTAQLLGISDKRLARIVAHTDIQFIQGSQSLASKQAHEERRGRARSVVLTADAIAKIALGRRLGLEKQHKRHTAFGVTGFVSELVRHFGCPVGAHSVSNRLRRGMTIEQALTTEAVQPKRGVFPPQFTEWLEKCRRRTRARVLNAIARRLKPTMLRYRSPDYSIVVSRSQSPWISVEITSDGHLLHRLRFIKSFDESGVLFAFTQGKPGNLDFIAFEPDSEALLRGKEDEE